MSTTTLIPSKEMPKYVPGTTTQSWAAMRYKGTGPKYVKINGRIYYRESDLSQWIESNVHATTEASAR